MEPIPFARPDITDREIAAVARVMRSGWLTTGPEALAFEKEFGEYVHARHALAVNSATAGLHLSLEAMGIGEGDLVFTSPFTFAATAEVARYLGAEVRFADIDSATGCLAPEALDRAVATATGGTPAAVIPVHYGGAVCDMEAINGVARRYKLRVVEDAAHAFPAETERGFAGTLAEAGVFSFYATKPLTTGEGGMVCTDDDDLAKRIHLMRLHGIDREAWDRYRSPGASWYYEVTEAGFKYNLSDMLAAVGRVQLERAGEILRERRRLAKRYEGALRACPFLELPPDAPEHAWHLYPVLVRPVVLGSDRDTVVERLKEAGIGTSVHYVPLHVMPYYARRYSHSPGDFPVAFDRYTRTFSLPLYSGLSDADQDRVIETLTELPRLVQ